MARPADEVFEHDGKTALVIEPRRIAMLENCTLDLETTDDGTQLTLQ